MTVIYDKEGTYFLNFIQEVSELSNEKLRYNKCITLLGEEYAWIANYLVGSNVPMDGILEIAATRTTERGSRADDKRSETAMEDRKKQGYF